MASIALTALAIALLSLLVALGFEIVSFTNYENESEEKKNGQNFNDYWRIGFMRKHYHGSGEECERKTEDKQDN